MWSFLSAVCTVVGAFVLYSVVAVLVWRAAVALVVRQAPLVCPVAGEPVGDASGQGVPGLSAGGAKPAAGTAVAGWDCWRDDPRWVAQDRGWAATVLLLGAPPIAERSHRHVDLAARRVHWAGLLGDAASWAEPHRLLVLAAYDLSGAAEDLRGTPVSRPPVAVLSLHELATADESTVHRVGAAFELTRGRARYATSVAQAGGLG